ncbi:RnfABCDGE type electron transport complex subunit C, partial [Thermodesulfobacteriota bacterium]
MDAFWPTFKKRVQMPPCQREATAGKPSTRMPDPEGVVLPLQDVLQDEFEVSVDNGQTVRQGQKIGSIGKPPEHVAVHAPIAGEVAAVMLMPHPLVQQVTAIRIASNGSGARQDASPFSESGSSDRLEFFRDMGIPLDYKVIKDLATLLINVTEFEPSVSSKETLVIEEQEKFISGIKLLLEVSRAEKAVIVCESGNARLSAVLDEVCRAVAGASVQQVSRPYPDTVHELLRQRRLGGGASGPDLYGVAVVEPGIVVAVHDAYYCGQPFIEQLVTVVGSAVRTPQNMWVKTGTMIKDIIQQAGGNTENPRRVTLGGPLMGRPQYSLDAPLIKKARAVFVAAAIAFDEERKSRFYKRCPCVRCGKCVDVCPSGIMPNILADLVEHRRFDEAERLGLFSCLECGLCYYVCPSMIPLVELLKLGKLNSKGRDSLLIF